MEKTKKYIGIIFFAGMLLASAGIIFAEDKANLNTTNSIVGQVRNTIKEKAEQQVNKIKELRTQAQEKVKIKIEKVKEKITQIKDTKKKQAADKIINQINRTNQVWTDHFTNVLNQLDGVLGRIQTRADKAATNGKDISAVNTAITTAKVAIETARTAVANQAKKTYTVDSTVISTAGDISTTAGQNQLLKDLRDQFKAQKDQLKTDLTNIRDGAMKDARTAVHNIVQILSSITDVNKDPATNSSDNNQ